MGGGRRLQHRVGKVADISSVSEYTNSAGRTWRFTHAAVTWDGSGSPERIELRGDYQVGDRTVVIWRGGAQICDVNLQTGQQCAIGDRVEGLPALVMMLALPLNFVLVGLPFYYGVALWSKVSTAALRKKVGAYVAAHVMPWAA